MLLRVFNLCHNKPLSISEERKSENSDDEERHNKLSHSNESGNEDADDEDEYMGPHVTEVDHRNATQTFNEINTFIPQGYSGQLSQHLDDGQEDRANFKSMSQKSDRHCSTSSSNHHLDGVICSKSETNRNNIKTIQPTHLERNIIATNSISNQYRLDNEDFDIAYLSDYARMRHTNEIVLVQRGEIKQRSIRRRDGAKTTSYQNSDYDDKTMQMIFKNMRRQKMKKLSKFSGQSSKKTTVQPFPDNLLMFLTVYGKSRQQSFLVPHIIRFIPLSSGVTVLLISEVSLVTQMGHCDFAS